MTLFHAVVIGSLAVVLLTAIGNALYLGRTSRELPSTDLGLVSVCVPARNEVHRLGDCLASLVAQSYPRYEVLVLDDGSTDGTGALARSFVGRVPGLRVIDGAPLADGWVGKPHACARLAAEARGEWLLFTDADVTFGRDGISRGVAASEASRADLLTVFPGQTLGSLAERATVPLLFWAVAGFLPMFLMERSRSARMAAASGQYMLFRRTAYEALGGHAAVLADVVEDVGLARLVRRAGRRLVIVNGRDVVSCRMYTGWGDVVEGFSKNAFAGLGNSVVNLTMLAVFWLACFVVPPAGLVVALARGENWRSFALETALAVGGRLVVGATLGHPAWTALLHPFSIVVALGIAVRSFWLTRFRGGVRWKGRRIPERPASGPPADTGE